MTTNSMPPDRRRPIRLRPTRRRALPRLALGALAVAAPLAALPAAASGAWSTPQTVCTACSESDDLSALAVAPNGAAVLAWHGDQTVRAAYRAPGGDSLGELVTLGSGGKPQFVRAATGPDGTGAVVTWLPAVANSQVVRVHGPTGAWRPVVPTPAGLAGPQIAVAPDGAVALVGWVTSATNVQSLVAYELAPSATTWSAPATLATLAAPFITRVGATLLAAGPGGDLVAAWTFSDGATNVLGYAAVKPAGGPWGTPEAVAVAPSTVAGVSVDAAGNALATVDGNRAAYRSYLAAGWEAPTALPGAGAGEIGFDQAGNAGLLAVTGGSQAFVRRAVTDGATGVELLPASSHSALAVSSPGDVVVVQQATGLASQWSSTLSVQKFTAPESLPGTGSRTLIGVGIDATSTATAAWSTPSTSSAGNGDVVAATRPAGGGGTVSLTAQQLLINQRISQAAVLRSNGALTALQSGLPATAFRRGGLGGTAFSPGVPVTGTATPAAPSAAPGYRVPIPAKTGTGGTVSLTAQQLLINQRISQAAVRRANAVRDRLTDGLTSAQIGAGVITAPNLRPGLAFGALGAPATGTPISVPSGGSGGGTVTLTTQQILINQRISQAAVRRSNLNIAMLQSGLTQADIAAGGIGSQNVTP